MSRLFRKDLRGIPLDPPSQAKGEKSRGASQAKGEEIRRIFFGTNRGGAHRQSGLTLVELLVALVISLILLAGLVTVFAAMNSSFSTTKRLNNLVGQQRLASTVMTNTIASAGYWPITNQTARGRYRSPNRAFPARNVNFDGHTFQFNAGQVIAGNGATSAGALNVVMTRMLLPPKAPAGTPSAPVFNCQGGVNTSGSFVYSINVFWVDNTRNRLMCTVMTGGGKSDTAPLLGGEQLPVPGKKYGGVKAMSVVYGVDIDADGSVDRYMSADTLNSAAGRLCANVRTGKGNALTCWPFVRSARLTLDFVSAVAPDETFELSRNIVLSNASGLHVQPGGGIPMGPPASASTGG